MSERQYMRLPVAADEGFPQAFRMSFAAASYEVSLYVSVVDDALLATDDPIDLTRPGAYMVMTVAREGPAAAEVIFRRRLVADHEYEAAELAFVFRRLRVDRRNLNGAGAFGSEIVGGVAPRWA